MPRQHEPSQWWAHFPSHEEYRLLSQAHSFIRVGSTSNSLFCFILFCRYPPRSTLYDYCLLMSHLLWGTLISFWWYIYYALAFISLIKVSPCKEDLIILHFTDLHILLYAQRDLRLLRSTRRMLLQYDHKPDPLFIMVFKATACSRVPRSRCLLIKLQKRSLQYHAGRTFILCALQIRSSSRELISSLAAPTSRERRQRPNVYSRGSLFPFSKLLIFADEVKDL